MSESPWHVLQVVANHEKRVARQLEVRSIEHYLPYYTERSRWTDRTVTLERPLFPGYVFTRFSAATRISVISTPGVLRLLGKDGNRTVDGAEIARIQKALVSGHILRPQVRVPVGTRVRIRGGLFEGVEGIVSELRRNCNVIIALSAVGQCFSLETDLSEIEVLGRTVVSCGSCGMISCSQMGLADVHRQPQFEPGH